MNTKREFNKKLFMFICGQIVASKNAGYVTQISKACDNLGVERSYTEQFIRIMMSKGFITVGSRNYIKYLSLTKAGCDEIRKINAEKYDEPVNDHEFDDYHEEMTTARADIEVSTWSLDQEK